MQKPIDRWLSLFATVVGIGMTWIPKTPIFLVGSFLLMFLLLFHPVWNFWWIEKSFYRRLSALILLALLFLSLGYFIWPSSSLPNIGATLIVDTVDKKYINCHINLNNSINSTSVKNLRYRITTPDALQMEFTPPEVRNLQPGRDFTKELSPFSLKMREQNWVSLSLLYSTETEGMQRTFNSTYRFFFSRQQAKNGNVIYPDAANQIKTNEDIINNGSMKEALSRLSHAEGTVFVVLTEKNEDGSFNKVSFGDNKKAFLFDPERRVVSFTFPVKEQIRTVTQSLKETRSHMHIISIDWNDQMGGHLNVDGEGADNQVGGNGPTKVFTQNFPGISFQALIRLNDISANRGKYLIDFGEKNGSHFSVYISPDNRFTFSFIDALGKPHLIQVPIGNGGVPLGKFFYLVCELGIDGQSTLLRMLIDDKEIKYIKLPFKIDFGGEIYIRGGVIGTDLNGANGASFDMGTMTIFSTTMMPSQIAAFAKIALDHYKSAKRNLITFRDNKQVLRISKLVFYNTPQNNKLLLLIDPNMGVKYDKRGALSKLYDISENHNDVIVENK